MSIYMYNDKNEQLIFNVYVPLEISKWNILFGK